MLSASLPPPAVSSYVLSPSCTGWSQVAPDTQGFFDRLGNYDSKLAGFLPICRLDFRNYSISRTQYILNPPLERKLLLQLVSHCIFSKPHVIGILQINQGHPLGGSAIPKYLQSLTSPCLPCVHID